MALQPPFLVLNALCFVWGLGAGITLTQGRTVLQIVAPPTHRARLLALFQLGLGGGGPIGAFIAGSLAAVLGLKFAMVLPALAMVVADRRGAGLLARLDDAHRGAAGLSSAAGWHACCGSLRRTIVENKTMPSSTSLAGHFAAP